MIQEKARILANNPSAPGYYTMRLDCSGTFGAARPGQFVMLTTGTGSRPLLRRPFSIHRLGPAGTGRTAVEILYKVVGEGTALMARMTEGGAVDILGPLGQGFAIRESDRRIYLAAGGIGTAPMLFLLETLRRNAADGHYQVFLGGRSRNDLLCRAAFERLADRVHCTTDDGSEGAHCFLTSPLDEEAHRRPPDAIMACGPMDMLACVAGIAERLHIPCQVSIESAMACGMGACLGCAVPAAGSEGRYYHVCKDGPVFDARLLKR